MGDRAVISVNPEWDAGTVAARVAELRVALGDEALFKSRGGNWFTVDAEEFAAVGADVMEGFVLRSGSLPDAVDLATSSPAQQATVEGHAAAAEVVAEVGAQVAAEAPQVPQEAPEQAPAPQEAPPAPAKAKAPAKKAAARKAAPAKKAAAKKAAAKKAAAPAKGRK